MPEVFSHSFCPDIDEVPCGRKKCGWCIKGEIPMTVAIRLLWITQKLQHGYFLAAILPIVGNVISLGTGQPSWRLKDLLLKTLKSPSWISQVMLILLSIQRIFYTLVIIAIFSDWTSQLKRNHWGMQVQECNGFNVLRLLLKRLLMLLWPRGRPYIFPHPLDRVRLFIS